MEEVNYKKLNRSIKMYPIFYGLTADLIFWIAINTLFLTTIKHLSAAQINSIEAIGIGVGLVFQLFMIRIVRKIGNLNSVRIGTILLFLAVVLNTFSTKYIGFLGAEICCVIGFAFKYMDNVILAKNLNYLKKSDEFLKYQTKGCTIYSFITLVISIISGLMFNINPYIPMIICLLVCFNNIILTFFIYEVPINISKEENKDKKLNIKFDKKIILMILLYGLFYSMIACGQKNSKLFIQFNMQEILELNYVAIYMSVFIFISRIVRLASNIVFFKIHDRYKSKMLFILETFLVLSFCLLIIGNFIKNMAGIWIMAIGFFIFLLLRDPFDNYMKNALLKHSSELVHDKVINYLNLSRKVFTLIYSSMVAIMLLNLNYIYVMLVLLILSSTFMFLIFKIYNLIIKR